MESGGAEGVAAAREFQPDVILLDLNLPDLDGREVASAIGRDARVNQVPIIFMTAMVPAPLSPSEPQIRKPARLDDIIRSIESRTS